MDNFDWRTMSKMTSAAGVEYLRLEENGFWTASDREQTCVLNNTCLGYAVAMIDAKLYPINCVDRDAMIVSLQAWIRRCQKFLDEYGNRPNWKSSTEVKDARRGIRRMEKEITRLKGMEFSGEDHQ